VRDTPTNASEYPPVLPRGSVKQWRERRSSPGFGPRRSPSRSQDQWDVELAWNARYSGGAAPVLHRVSVSRVRFQLSERILPRCPLVGKHVRQLRFERRAPGRVLRARLLARICIALERVVERGDLANERARS